MKKKDKSLFLSVVIPAYNEAHNLRTGVLDSVNAYLSKQSYSWEVIIVDDGSVDSTADMAESFVKKNSKFKLLRQPHRGKGPTVITGMLSAKGDIVLFSDMDQATPIDQVEKVIDKIKSGSDVVIGSRSGREGAPIIRKIMAYGFSLLRLLILNLPFKDTQCGFKAFKKDASRQIFKRLKVFKESSRTSGASVSAGFDLEILYIARKLNLKVTDVPVDWHHKEGTKVNPIKDSWEGLRDLIKVKINALTNSYNV